MNTFYGLSMGISLGLLYVYPLEASCIAFLATLGMLLRAEIHEWEEE